MSVAAQFLKLVDKAGSAVAGEATMVRCEGQIEISDWNWTVANKEIKTAEGTGTGSGSRIEPTIFGFSKGPDRASIRLLQAMHSGEIFPEATFTLFEDLAGTELATGGEFHLAIVLTKVVVLKYTMTGHTGEKEVELDENWEFNYHEIKFLWNKGAKQAKFTRPPGADTEGPGTPVDKLVKEAKALSKPEGKDLKIRLNDLFPD